MSRKIKIKEFILKEHYDTYNLIDINLYCSNNEIYVTGSYHYTSYNYIFKINEKKLKYIYKLYNNECCGYNIINNINDNNNKLYYVINYDTNIYRVSNEKSYEVYNYNDDDDEYYDLRSFDSFVNISDNNFLTTIIKKNNHIYEKIPTTVILFDNSNKKLNKLCECKLGDFNRYSLISDSNNLFLVNYRNDAKINYIYYIRDVFALKLLKINLPVICYNDIKIMNNSIIIIDNNSNVCIYDLFTSRTNGIIECKDFCDQIDIYNHNIIVTSTVNKNLKLFDIRNGRIIINIKTDSIYKIVTTNNNICTLHNNSIVLWL